MPMMRRFLYLNREALDDYVSAIDGGSLQQTESQTAGTRRRGAKLGVQGLGAEASSERSSHESSTWADSDAARFDRLIATLDGDAETWLWFDIHDPDHDFAEAPMGSLVSWECDFYVPDAVRLLGGNGLTGMLDAIDAVRPSAGLFGIPTEGMPTSDQSSALRSLNLSASTFAIVGEDDDTDWKVVGSIGKLIEASDEGRAVIVGKVSRKLPAGRWMPLMTALASFSREQRRKMEKTRPPADAEGNYVEGPLVVLDILAIYR